METPVAPAAVFDFGDSPAFETFTAAANTGRRQNLRGYDADYVDIVDYIVRCTHKIWEEGGIGLIYTHYAHNAAVHTSSGLMYGRDQMITNTIRRQSASADRRAFADDVIWSGNDEDGFYTSHRVVSIGTNTGYSDYGPPTGRRITRWGIADCLSRENRIYEEWIMQDVVTEIRQLGLDPIETARQTARREADAGSYPNVLVARGEVERLHGQAPPEELPPPPAEFQVEDFVRRTLHEVWNWRLLDRITTRYAPNHVAWVPGHRKLYGHGDYRAFVLALLAAFSDLRLTVDHFCCLGDARRGYRAATRWTLQGTHDGPGWYGPPTGRRIYLIGATHHEIRDGKITREWTVFDEFALLKQIHWP